VGTPALLAEGKRVHAWVRDKNQKGGSETAQLGKNPQERTLRKKKKKHMF